MLVLGRNFGQAIAIGDDIVIRITKGQGSDCRVAIDAPRSLRIKRLEEAPEESVELPEAPGAPEFPKVLGPLGLPEASG